jgi:hypothetical protein
MTKLQNFAKVVFLHDQEEILIEELRNYPVLCQNQATRT